MKSYTIVKAADVGDVYEGTDVPGEFRPLKAALEAEQLAVTHLHIPPHSDFEPVDLGAISRKVGFDDAHLLGVFWPASEKAAPKRPEPIS